MSAKYPNPNATETKANVESTPPNNLGSANGNNLRGIQNTDVRYFPRYFPLNTESKRNTEKRQTGTLRGISTETSKDVLTESPRMTFPGNSKGIPKGARLSGSQKDTSTGEVQNDPYKLCYWQFIEAGRATVSDLIELLTTHTQFKSSNNIELQNVLTEVVDCLNKSGSNITILQRFEAVQKKCLNISSKNSAVSNLFVFIDVFVKKLRNQSVTEFFVHTPSHPMPDSDMHQRNQSNANQSSQYNFSSQYTLRQHSLPMPIVRVDPNPAHFSRTQRGRGRGFGGKVRHTPLVFERQNTHQFSIFRPVCEPQLEDFSGYEAHEGYVEHERHEIQGWNPNVFYIPVPMPTQVQVATSNQMTIPVEAPVHVPIMVQMPNMGQMPPMEQISSIMQTPMNTPQQSNLAIMYAHQLQGLMQLPGQMLVPPQMQSPFLSGGYPNGFLPGYQSMMQFSHQTPIYPQQPGFHSDNLSGLNSNSGTYSDNAHQIGDQETATEYDIQNPLESSEAQINIQVETQGNQSKEQDNPSSGQDIHSTAQVQENRQGPEKTVVHSQSNKP